MRYIEVRRHTTRTKPGQHLSQAGVTLARRVGESMGQYAQVLTSPLPRAYETAIAMGYAVDGQYEQLTTYGDAVEAELPYPQDFAMYGAAANRQEGAAADFARDQAAFWRTVARSLEDGEAALLISHGGVIELGAAACFPEADHASWGDALGLCEGVRIGYDKDQDAFAEIDILRVK